MQTDHESGPRTQIFEDMILNHFIVSISFIYTNHTKQKKSLYESHIDIDVKKFKLWGNFKNAIFIIKKIKYFKQKHIWNQNEVFFHMKSSDSTIKNKFQNLQVEWRISSFPQYFGIFAYFDLQVNIHQGSRGDNHKFDIFI